MDDFDSYMNFNPRSPYGERPSLAGIEIPILSFQSTLPIRGATALFGATVDTNGDFNPRSPYGERLFIAAGPDVISFNFNPRSPYGERRELLDQAADKLQFQSTLPIQGATHLVPFFRIFYPISIHAPHTGSDALRGPQGRHKAISIHAPHTGSDAKLTTLILMGRLFHSTLPIRGATRAA